MRVTDNCVHRLLDSHLAQGRGDAVCVRTEEGTVTYRELYHRVCRAANAFAAAGVEYENRVALVLPDSVDLLACVLGLLRIGAVPVPLSTALTAADYTRVFVDCRPRLAVVAPSRLADVLAARDATAPTLAPGPPRPRAVWVAPDAGADAAADTGADVAAADRAAGADAWWADRLADVPDTCPVLPTSPDDMAVIQYTSGSTGTPRGVVHLHRGLLAVLRGLPERLGLTAADVCFSAAKLSFAYGFGNSLLFPFAVGASTLLMPQTADAPRVLRLVRRCRPTVLFGVPALYAGVLTVAEREPTAGLPGVRLCVSAGEPLPPSLAERWRRRFGLDLLNGLGSTECLHIFLAQEPGRTPPGSSGTLVPGYEAELRDEQGRVLGPGEPGELWVRSEANAARYWNRQPETRTTMVGGWIRTGDQLRRDADGVFSYLARTDDVLKVGGMKVAPTEIEDCLLRHPQVRECAVVGVPGRHGTTEIVAYVRPVAGRPDSPEHEVALRRSLRAHLRGSLAPYKLPRTLHVVDDLPRTTTGKVARQQLRTRREG